MLFWPPVSQAEGNHDADDPAPAMSSGMRNRRTMSFTDGGSGGWWSFPV